MHSYFALQGRLKQAGGWYQLLAWANERIQIEPTPVKILVARPGNANALIVAEITEDGFRRIQDGRQVTVRSLHGKA